MTEYRVMAKFKYDKRFHCYGYHSDAKHADKHAESLSEMPSTKEVKIIITDSNGIANELTYKGD